MNQLTTTTILPGQTAAAFRPSRRILRFLRPLNVIPPTLNAGNQPPSILRTVNFQSLLPSFDDESCSTTVIYQMN